MKDKYLKSEKRIVKNIPLFYIVCAGIVLLCAGITLGMLFARNDDEPSVDTGKIGEQCVLPYTLVRVVKLAVIRRSTKAMNTQVIQKVC